MADSYHVHGEQAGITVGAELLARKDVTKEFLGNVNDCCLVVLVALYPKKDEPLEVSPQDFTLNIEGTDAPLRSQNPGVIAAKLKKRTDAGPRVVTAAGVGYESGSYIDPVTGQPVRTHGVSTSTGVGVENGSGVPADVAARDREIIERELTEKGLPEGKSAAPVAGYLYFAVRNPKKNTKYELTYVVHDKPLTLSLP